MVRTRPKAFSSWGVTTKIIRLARRLGDVVIMANELNGGSASSKIPVSKWSIGNSSKYFLMFLAPDSRFSDLLLMANLRLMT